MQYNFVMANVKHGQIIDGILYKRGTQVVKFWKHDGYAIPIEEVIKVKGVRLYTKYDGKLYASREAFDQHGIPHLFRLPNGNVEHQLILPVRYWESF